MANLLAVMAGGAIGSGLRYLVSVGSLRTFGPHFPWGTLTVNALGSLLLGMLFHFFAARQGTPEPMKLLFTVGFCGGFTTYSTFNTESLKLMSDGRTGIAVGYMALTVALCLALGYAGLRLGRTVWTAG
jgi:CrcB protein